MLARGEKPPSLMSAKWSEANPQGPVRARSRQLDADLLIGDGCYVERQAVGEGDDKLYGGSEDDVLFGREGDDLLKGEAGDDELYGQDGDDTLDGGADNNTCDGGSGTDSSTNCG